MYVHLDVPSKSLDAQIHAEVLPKQQIQGKPASLAMASSANATPLGGCGAFAGDYGDYGESYGGGAAGGFPANGGMMVPPKMQFPPKVAWSKNGIVKCWEVKMDVSENSGTPKSSILIGFSIINHPFLGYPYFWKHPDGEEPPSLPGSEAMGLPALGGPKAPGAILPQGTGHLWVGEMLGI